MTRYKNSSENVMLVSLVFSRIHTHSATFYSGEEYAHVLLWGTLLVNHERRRPDLQIKWATFFGPVQPRSLIPRCYSAPSPRKHFKSKPSFNGVRKCVAQGRQLSAGKYFWARIPTVGSR